MKISLWSKMVVCVLAGVLCLYAVHTDVGHRLPHWFPESVLSFIAVALLILSLLSIFVWQFLEHKNKVDSQRILAFWQGVIIYGEVLIFLRFGFLKLFALHMNSTLIAEDFPAGTMSNYHLMDYFFSRAPQFKILIGSLQIMGAMALLFRKTRLLGIFVLMPVIVNIVCMDVLYDIGGITVVAVVLFFGLVYLLFQDKEKLIDFFFKSTSSMPVVVFKNNIIKNGTRLSALVITLVILVPSIHPLKNATIIGKYDVNRMRVNGKLLKQDLNNDTLPGAVYFDENETCLLRYNNYRKVKIGKAIYNETNGDLEVIWRFPKQQGGTSFWKLTRTDEKNKFILSGTMGREDLEATLTKTTLATVLFH